MNTLFLISIFIFAYWPFLGATEKAMIRGYGDMNSGVSGSTAVDQFHPGYDISPPNSIVQNFYEIAFVYGSFETPYNPGEWTVLLTDYFESDRTRDEERDIPGILYCHLDEPDDPDVFFQVRLSVR